MSEEYIESEAFSFQEIVDQLLNIVDMVIDDAGETSSFVLDNWDQFLAGPLNMTNIVANYILYKNSMIEELYFLHEEHCEKENCELKQGLKDMDAVRDVLNEIGESDNL